MNPLTGGSGSAPALPDGPNVNIEMVDGNKPTDRGVSDEPVMASPRWVSAPDSPPHSAQAPPELAPDDSGHT